MAGIVPVCTHAAIADAGMEIPVYGDIGCLMRGTCELVAFQAGSTCGGCKVGKFRSEHANIARNCQIIQRAGLKREFSTKATAGRRVGQGNNG